MGCCIVIAFMGIKISLTNKQSEFSFDGRLLLTYIGARVSVCIRNVVFLSFGDIISRLYEPLRAPPPSFIQRVIDFSKFLVRRFTSWQATVKSDSDEQPAATQSGEGVKSKKKRRSKGNMTAPLLSGSREV